MNISEVICFKQNIFTDSRGSFEESYNKLVMKKILKKNFKIHQQNISISKYGVLRGIHYQTKNIQAKIIRVVDGKIFDVVIDLRKKSESFGKWKSFILSSNNRKQLYIPEGFAHGFLSMKEKTIIQYFTNNAWDKNSENTILWNDPSLKIKWPKIKSKILISKKDKFGKFFKDSKFF